MDMANLFISLLLTAFIYLFVPSIFAIRACRKSLSSIKKIIIINGVVIYIFFTTINFLSGIDQVANISATLLWSYIGFAIMKKRCLKNDDGFVIDISENPIHRAEGFTTEIPKKYCKLCGNLIDNTSRQCTGCGKQYFKGIHFKIRHIIFCLLFVLVVVLGYNVHSLSKENTTLVKANEQLHALQKENKTLTKTNKELRKKNNAFSSIKYTIYPIYTPNANGSAGYSSVKNSPMEIKSVGKDIVFVSTADNEKYYVTLEQLKNGKLMMGAKFTYKAYFIDDAIEKGYAVLETP